MYTTDVVQFWDFFRDDNIYLMTGPIKIAILIHLPWK